MADTPPPFDPSKPFTVAPATGAPAFDPAKPFTRGAADPETGTSPFVPQKPEGPGRLQRLWQGLVDPAVGAGQFAAHAGVVTPEAGMPEFGVAGAPGAMEPLVKTSDVDTAVQQRERSYQDRRKAGGQLGTDWYRLLGNMVSTAPLAAIPGMQGGVVSGLVGGAAAGAAGAAMEPITGGNNFAGEKTKQIGVGAALGAPLGAVGGAIAPGLGADASRLANAGVRLTPGQALGAPGIERSLQAFPILRGYVQGAQGRSVDDFNRAVVSQALAPIGAAVPRSTKAGHDLITYATDKLSGAYDKLLPDLQLDREGTTQAISRALASTKGELSEDNARRLQAIIQNRILGRFEPSETAISGETFKKMESDLSRRIASFHPGTVDSELGSALNDVLGSIREELAVQNPLHAPELSKINEAYRMFARVRSAAARRGESEGVFTPSDLLAAVKTSDKSAGRGAFARGDALLQGFAEAGHRVIGKSAISYPDLSAGGMIAGAPVGAALAPVYQTLRGLQRIPRIGGGLDLAAPAAGGIAGRGIEPQPRGP